MVLALTAGCIVMYNGDKLAREGEGRTKVNFESEMAARLL